MKNALQMMKMIRKGPTIDQYVIKENCYKFLQEGTEQGVHGRLKGRGCVAQAEGHDPIFVVTVMGVKCGFRNVVIRH